MANYSRWDDIKKQRPGPTDEERAATEQDFALGELIYELRTSAGLSQRDLAERMGTTQSVISRLEKVEADDPVSTPSPASPSRSRDILSCLSPMRCPSASRTRSRSPEARRDQTMTDKDVIYHSYPPADMTAAEFEHFVVEMLQQTESAVDSLDIGLHEVVDGADGSYDFGATIRYRLFGMDLPVLVEANHHSHPIKRQVVQVLESKIR